MNWFKKSLGNNQVKVAYPYSMELCPYCSQSLVLDLYWERGYENPPSLPIGRCKWCHRTFSVQATDQEEQPGFKYSILTPISYVQYNKMLGQGSPEILVTVDEENFATTPA